jgi:hypothetical protein
VRRTLKNIKFPRRRDGDGGASIREQNTSELFHRDHQLSAQSSSSKVPLCGFGTSKTTTNPGSRRRTSFHPPGEAGAGRMRPGQWAAWAWLGEGRGQGPSQYPPRQICALRLCVRRPPTSARHQRCFVLLACRWKTRKTPQISSQIANKKPGGGLQQRLCALPLARQNTADLKCHAC